MKYFISFVLLAICVSDTLSQKPPIDISVFGKWPSIGVPMISNDGNYTLYIIHNQPAGSNTLVIKAIHTNWKLEILNASKALITEDSRLVVFMKPKDSLGILTLGSASIEYISNVRSFKLPKKTSEWLTYQLNTPARELIARKLATGKEYIYSSVRTYSLSENGKVLLLQLDMKKDSTITQFLNWVSLTDGKMTNIWQGTKSSDFIFDVTNTQLTFISEDKINNELVNSLWYYKAGTDKAEQLADDYSTGIEVNLKIAKIQRFSNDGRHIFFSLKERSNPKPKSDAVKLDVYSYTDSKLQSQQLLELEEKKNLYSLPYFGSVIHIQGHRIIRLEQEDDLIMSFGFSIESKDDHVLILNSKGDAGNEWNWNNAAKASIYLVSIKDGTRKLINKNLSITATSYRLSPTGKYIIFYDPEQKNYFSYTVSSGIIRNLTHRINGVWTTYERNDEPKSSYIPLGIAGFVENDTAVLIYDQHDIFQVDIAGKLLPINLTAGYGRKHNIVFRLAMNYRSTVIKPNEKLILNAFNRGNKNDGFFSITLGNISEPRLLTMQPYIFKGPDESQNVFSIAPIKARDVEIYLVRRMSATESPNYFSTSNFQVFNAISTIHPETTYNWLTTELVTWKTLDGVTSQGILYKPENFDSKRKYPIIFHYYEKCSEALHAFIEPDACLGPINIPFFVSNGYLVFTPDIHFIIGKPGKSAYSSIVSAAKFLSKMSWVDTNRMGVQGHSFGGFETNYIIAHTNMFAAAMSSSSMSNFISAYGSIIGDGTSRQRQYELYRDRIGATLWQRPDLYIENSPIFQADKVKTPLLMMNNKDDGDVPFSQGVEFFTALRRLGKKVWMLQYDGRDHLVFDKAALDLTTRMTQFFDHYLKGSPAPKWMTKGIPAKMKGIDLGYEFDYNTKELSQGLVEKP